MTRAVLVTPDYTVLDGTKAVPTPLDAWVNGPEQMARRIGAKQFDRKGEGVVLVDGDAARRLGVTDSWQTYDGSPRIYLGSIDAIDWCPLIHREWPQDTAGAFRLFHDRVGVAYHRSPGVTGLSLLQHLNPKGKAKPIAWESPQPAGAAEHQWYPEDWRGSWGTRYAHGYDKRRAGLAAMTTVRPARYALRHTGRMTFDPSYAGWWKIEVPAWNYALMPDPAGYCNQHDHQLDGVCVRWVTTPTMELLDQLAAEGVTEGARFVLDSWTSPRSTFTVGWAEHVERVYRDLQVLAGGQGDAETCTALPGDAERVLEALSAVYRETPGMFAGARSWVKRLDWYAAHVAVNRANLWRAAWKIGQQEDRWPIRFDGDKVWYPSDDPDGTAARPAGLTLGNRLGEYRHDGTAERQ